MFLFVRTTCLRTYKKGHESMLILTGGAEFLENISMIVKACNKDSSMVRMQNCKKIIDIQISLI